MAARKFKGTIDKPWDDKVRAKIQASMFINRLISCAEGKLKLESNEIKAIEVLTRKVLPDLSSITIGGDAQNPIFTEIVMRVITPKG